MFGEETVCVEETEGDLYVTSLSQLTADGLESVDEWAREVYESEETRTEEQSLESFTNVGQYLLLPKDPETEGNILCMAYVAQIRTEHDGGDGTKYRKTDSVYWYISLKDVRQDEEGKLNIWETDFEIPEDTFTITFTSELAWTYTGYQTLDDLYRKAVTTHIDVYSHEDMSDESAVPEAEEEEVVTPENLAQQKASETGIYVSPSTSLAVCEITALSNSGSGVTVTWNAVEGASGYKVYRRTGSEIFSQIGTVDGGTAVSYTDQGVKDANGTSYTYAVTAVSGDIAGSYTEKSTVRLTAPALSDVKAGGSAGTLTVTWAASDKITGYQIQYSTDKDFKEGNQDTKVNGAGAVTSDLKSLTSGQTYYVRIRTYLTEGDSTYYSAWSSAKSAAAP